MIRRLVAALALVAIGISVPLATAPAHAAKWSDGPCTDNVGITIVIDFQELGGGVNVSCAPGPVTTGLDALDKAGVSWEGALRFPGFVCRIAGRPGPAAEACANTPPATDFWSYWIAPRGGSWCYSTVGPGNRTPPTGSVEGWSFAHDRNGANIPPPGYAPPATIPGEPPNPLKGADCGTPSTPSPTSTTTAPTTTTASPPAPTVASNASVPPDTSAVAEPTEQGSPSTSASATAGTPTKSAGSSTTTSVALATAGTSTTTSTSGPRSADTAPTSPDDSSSRDTISSLSSELGAVNLGDDGRGGGGFGVATAIGIAVAAALGGAGVWAARRRRAVT